MQKHKVWIASINKRSSSKRIRRHELRVKINLEEMADLGRKNCEK